MTINKQLMYYFVFKRGERLMYVVEPLWSSCRVQPPRLHPLSSSRLLRCCCCCRSMGYKIAAISFSLRPRRRPPRFFFLFVTPLLRPAILAFARLDKCHPAVRLFDGSEKNIVVCKNPFQCGLLFTVERVITAECARC